MKQCRNENTLSGDTNWKGTGEKKVNRRHRMSSLREIGRARNNRADFEEPQASNPNPMS